MKNPLLKKILPHIIAVAVFLIVSLLFCKPALEGNVLNQGDIVGWKGMAQNAFEYKEKHGHYPLWNPNLFSGMPNYQTAMEGKSILPNMNIIFSLGLPKPVYFFFIAAICFYILCIVLGINPAIGILGGLAYAFSTYNPVIISAGHETKMFAIAYMPLLMAGLISTFEKKYWLGLALTTMGSYLEISVNHVQITYYALLIAFAITLSYLYVWIKRKEWKHIGIAAGITAISAILGIAGNALTLMTSAEYTPYTMRGGKDISIEGDNVKAIKTTGLDTSYAFEYSLGKAEAAVILMPKSFGERSGTSDGRLYALDENSHVVKKLVDRGVPENNAIQLATGMPKYWGGVDGAAGTAGPPYIGAIICLLALIGFVIYKNPLRWALLVMTILGIMMAWGKYLPGFNTFLFNHLPLYNKFRAPTMALVIAEFTLPVMAMITLQILLYRDKSRELLKADFKKILYATGGLFALLILMYLGMNYSSPFDRQILSYKFDNSGNNEINRLIISGMKADRKAMFGGQLLRTFGFAVLVLGLLYMYLKNIIKPVVVTLIFIFVSSIDLFVIGKEYLNEDNYVLNEDLGNKNFPASEIDQQILRDKDPDFRVFNLISNPYTESHTSYFHKSIGGYHPAKLRIYQDIIDKYLSGPFNPGILNMLNTKYMITQDQQTGKVTLITRSEAFGPCWLVKNVRLVNDRVEAIQSLGTTSLKDTAIVEKIFSKNVVQPQWDSASFIKLTKFDNDAIEYESNCSGPEFAVFSEVYYPKGWNAYIDGKKTDYCNVDYILRGISLPAGKHAVKFVFEPATVKKGTTIMYIASYFIVLFFIGGLFMAWRENRKIS